MARTKVFDEHLILEKAMELFWQKGYNATSAQDLVDNLGISRSSMYDTYGDKHSLFLKALELYRRERIDPVIKGLTTADDIEAYVRSIFKTVKAEAVEPAEPTGCFMVNSAVELATVDSDVRTIANAIMRDTEEALYNAIQKGQDEGIFTTAFPARALGRFVLNSLNGFRVTMKFDASERMFDDIVDVCLSVLKGRS
ncbi:TetR family transcriptional regulator [Sphingobacterium allocomposti]|uniref:TetR family transcriptional regulator n=1 Tax=Sphingobacterium allocomposti TaxID=415956 RepID=A0A5S5DR07_9SPHI|nr:TetR/AcrR family transcriptional regulator [Sphingobacterium composti Yoo et al. 2007 non Ten et al. 2007]TYP97089.1 TetR family transcriptional regulator [Sphingobacterium composti Yoo et al. 2007 non Ten et al. 2007]